MQPKLYLILIVAICLVQASWAQDSLSTVDKVLHFPSSFFTKVNNKTAKLEDRLTKQTEKYLQKLAKREARLKRKLSKIDSTAAKNCFAADPEQQYDALIQKLKSAQGSKSGALSGAYMPYIDSLKGSLSFLNDNPELIKNSKILPADIQKSLGQLQQLQGKMQQADEIKQFIQHYEKEFHAGQFV
jgi:hypothetical protein